MNNDNDYNNGGGSNNRDIQTAQLLAAIAAVFAADGLEMPPVTINVVHGNLYTGERVNNVVGQNSQEIDAVQLAAQLERQADGIVDRLGAAPIAGGGPRLERSDEERSEPDDDDLLGEDELEEGQVLAPNAEEPVVAPVAMIAESPVGIADGGRVHVPGVEPVVQANDRILSLSSFVSGELDV